MRTYRLLDNWQSIAFLLSIFSFLPIISSSSTYNRPHAATRGRPRKRSACRVYVWDGPSALRYHICKHLLRENIYEGRGGKKFVRIKPGSILDSLYPPSDHSPDRCLICGLSFRDHLTQWWFPNLYTPYDLYLERVKNLATNSDVSSIGNSRGRSKRKSATEPEITEPGMKPFERGSERNYFGSLAYHKPYARILDEKPIDKSNKLKKRSKKNESNQIDETSFERRRTESNIFYSVPKFDRGSRGAFGSNLLFLVRAIVLEEVEILLWMQQRESILNQWKKMYHQ